MLNIPMDTTVTNYGDDYAGVALEKKMQRRIVADILKMKNAKGKNALAEWDMPSKLAAASNSVAAEGYMAFGVFLHLVQDIQAHRARVASNMIYYNGTYSKKDTFVDSAEESHINTSNIKNASVGSTLNGILTVIGSPTGLPMIRLKDYLIDKITIYINGEPYTFKKEKDEKGNVVKNTLNQAYEDNPYFYAYRFSTAQTFSANYMTSMLHDTGKTTNRTTYYTSGYVPVV